MQPPERSPQASGLTPRVGRAIFRLPRAPVANLGVVEEAFVARRIGLVVVFAAALSVVLPAAAPAMEAAAQAQAPAPAILGLASLRQLTRDADLIVSASIVAARADVAAGAGAYPIVHTDVHATLKGTIAPGPLVFVNVGPRATSFTDGEEVLLFLRAIERVPELAATPLATRLRWVVIPNAGEKLAPRPQLTNAVARYVALDAIPDPDTRGDALRALSLELVKSGDPFLVTSVLRDVAPGGDAAALTLADLPALAPLIENPRVPIGTRIALVAELERRGLVFGPARWVRLLRTSSGDDLLAVIRAVGEHPSAGVTAHLLPMLDDRDFAVATAVATALGIPGNVDAVRPLTASLARDDRALRLAALASLTRIGTQSARQAIELVAARHPDRELRERADIEALTLARRHGTTLAPTLGTPDSALTQAPPH